MNAATGAALRVFLVSAAGLLTAAVICYGLAALSTADLTRFRVRRGAVANLPIVP